MAALTAGKNAPEFKLPLLDGGAFSLRDTLASGPVVLAFFKVSCPTCQYAFPFLDRLNTAHRQSGVSVIGISQNEKKETEEFNRRYGVHFPVALDQPGYPASNAYGLTNVPSIFLIAPGGKIEVSSVGWAKADIEEIHRRLRESAAASTEIPAALWQRTESVLDFKAG